MEKHIEKFIHYISFEKRFSKHTIIAYKNDLEQLLAYLNQVYSISRLEEINHAIIRSWMVYMIEEGILARTINRKITTLKTFYKFLKKDGVNVENPLLKIQTPKTSKRLPVFVEKDQMRDLLDKIKYPDTFDGIRDKLIIELFYATGIRLSELIGIKEKDVDFSNSSIKVLGKRNKERIIPISKEIFAHINHYLNEKTKIGRAEDYLFVLFNGKKMYPKKVYSSVNQYLSLVTTLDKKSPHVLRHTFATHLLNNGADINVIKELLGHSSLAATQIYTHNTIEKLKNIHKKAHPKS